MFTANTRVRDCTFLEATAAMCLAQLTDMQSATAAAALALSRAVALCAALDSYHAAQEAQEDAEEADDSLENG